MFLALGWGIYHVQQTGMSDRFWDSLDEASDTVTASPAQQDKVVVLTDTQGRELACRVLRVDADSVRVIRLTDGEKFTISLDRLDRASRNRLKPQAGTSVVSEFGLYEHAKQEVRVTLVISERTPNTKEIKRFLTAENIAYVVYDVERSGAGRRIMEEHGLTHGPVLLIGDEIMVGFSFERFRQLMVKAYQAQDAER